MVAAHAREASQRTVHSPLIARALMEAWSFRLTSSVDVRKPVPDLPSHAISK
jgi:hypothetical protein